jgi:hypothetical protein
MTVSPVPDNDPEVRLRVDAGRMWAGGLATALVAALVAVVGVLVARGLFDVKEYKPSSAPTLAAGSIGTYAVTCAIVALLATGLMHLLVTATPRPFRFFGWIMFLVIATAFLAPLVVDAPDDVRISSAVINLAVGISIASLVTGVAKSAIRVSDRRLGPSPYNPYPTRAVDPYQRPGAAQPSQPPPEDISDPYP